MKLGFLLVLSLLLAEGFLRIQQKMGPYYDLELKYLDDIVFSEELNHVPVSDGKRWDESGIRIMGNLIPENIRNDPKSRKILFMGDSFMEGFGGKDDIAWQVWNHYQSHQLPMIPYNAGYSSYAPSIFVPQARKLIPILKPNNVVIVIDNTDLADDNYRYEAVTIRDDKGNIQRVNHNPAMDIQGQTFRAVRSHWLYLVRAVHKLYFTRFSADRLVLAEREQKVINLTIDDAPDAATKYKAEVELFERNLKNLADVLTEQLGSGDRIIWVCHPHPQHLNVGPGDKKHHRLVFESVERVARAKGIHYYDATADLKREFGDKYRSYYMPNDAYYHFNPEGMAIYSKCIYEALPASWKQPLP